MAATPKRRWFQFRLRTLLVGVVLIGAACGYVGHEWRIVAARHALLEGGLGKQVHMYVDGNGDQIPLIRRLLGDRGCKTIILDDPNLTESYRAAFPESYIGVARYGDGNDWVNKFFADEHPARPPY